MRTTAQQDLLIVYGLVELARGHRGTATEEHALELATQIADVHGLEIADAIQQLDIEGGFRGRTSKWEFGDQ